MAKGQRLNSEQIIALLRQIDVLTPNGKTLAKACKKLGTFEQSYCRWSKIQMPILIDEFRRKC
jgi:putative transposase